MIYPSDGLVQRDDEVQVESRYQPGVMIWHDAKDGPGGAVGDRVEWWGKGNVRRKKHA